MLLSSKVSLSSPDYWDQVTELSLVSSGVKRGQQYSVSSTTGEI